MSALVDVGALLGVPVLPAVVGIGGVVCVGPSTVQVYVYACRSLHMCVYYYSSIVVGCCEKKTKDCVAQQTSTGLNVLLFRFMTARSTYKVLYSLQFSV